MSRLRKFHASLGLIIDHNDVEIKTLCKQNVWENENDRREFTEIKLIGFFCRCAIFRERAKNYNTF